MPFSMKIAPQPISVIVGNDGISGSLSDSFIRFDKLNIKPVTEKNNSDFIEANDRNE